jgi:dTDP-4-amino-4,6-dideoxygalactose transaminase
LYVVRVSNRDALLSRLAAVGVGTGIHYPIPLHRQKAYRSFGYETVVLSNAEGLASEILSLPMFPNLTLQQQERVVNEIRKFTLAGEALEAQNVFTV